MRFEFPEEVEIFTIHFSNEEGEQMLITELGDSKRHSFLDRHEAEIEAKRLQQKYPLYSFTIESDYSSEQQFLEEEYENTLSGWADYCYEQQMEEGE